ncbi:type III-B CRISPR-associated protein Cas10/Cmr2 [Synechocystis sp. PCC 7338]|uniref:type III-B CRISPR-associated protein Cas10/Cmr2 n=1 Tax=Synechocystis sp. PCC 7338 TaxID=2732530 RepID=UPI001BB00842|nr:type III-B CRISPR-associated protein Cas10/Cmr2 [Synechocystis sp. PCC 7338]QUS62537.1 type III-B CRISPR-associated protein Cas10/Cmr2 [Synechocystis sp. PCC 7338]
MSEVYWQAKIWGLLHDPALKALHNNSSGRGENSFWQTLSVMQNWVENGFDPETSSKTIFKQIKAADFIASASDRGAIGAIPTAVNYDKQGLELSHLLSGQKHYLKLGASTHQQLLDNRRNFLAQKEQMLASLLPTSIEDDPKKVFWWLWRCLPEATCQLFGDETLHLMPAETRFPDSSIWSHASMTAALAGALTGYDLTLENLQKNWSGEKPHAYLAVFTFSPVQELIKASRKIKDFWAGSWVLHYLSAKVCWELAQQYGPDCFLYPSLYGQPLIDHWLLEKYADYGFDQWIDKPGDRQLLTAGFPNVIMLVLPKEKAAAAMQSAKNHLLTAWRDIADQVFEELQQRHWQKNLSKTDPTWKHWLDAQWQTYWSAMAIGAEGEALKSGAMIQKEGTKDIAEKEKSLEEWIQLQNKAFQSQPALFSEEEQAFQTAAAQKRLNNQGRLFSVNVGSWWADIFGQTRFALNAIKNARNWKLPTAFGPRSTISGMGPVVHPQSSQHQRDWVTEGETQNYWQRQAGLFDGSEQLNATETVKRGLEKVLAKILNLKNEEEEILKIIAASYPDLTSGVAGYLHTGNDLDRQQFDQACQTILDEFPWAGDVIKGMKTKWGIPLMDKKPQKYHPRLLNAGWLVEDVETKELQQLQDELKKAKQAQDNQEITQIQKKISQIKIQYRQDLQSCLDRLFPKNNPASWYLLAAGDGDGMSEWLKGSKMKPYADYFPQALTVPEDLQATFQPFSTKPKRMGPATHNALSRALLDFSNQLAPYLTEKRYAGRLIYSGGDDVLAYTNLWEWDSWLWDIRQAFRGAEDEQGEFDNTGHYWRLKDPYEGFPKRPLFTMGNEATISFGIVMAHHSVPLAIALENLWEAEEGAKEHEYDLDGKPEGKDAVQVRVLYGNGNVLKATCKFETFQQWQALVNIEKLDASTYETAATLLEQHPIPVDDAISPWVNAFVERRSNLTDNEKTTLRSRLACFFIKLWQTTNHTKDNEWEKEAKNWLKVAAFVKRNRQII